MAGPIRSMLPPSYQHLFGKLFDRPKVVETRATCEKCSMCNHGEPSPVPMDYFRNDTKCCTFWPVLPNYLVGAILADDDPGMAEGKRRIKAAIAKRIGVGPSFLSRPRKFSLLMSSYSEAFGRTRSLRCPYYDDDNPAGNCSIWKHRESVCMTYYCRYNGGVRGFEQWTALRVYLAYVERTLAVRAAYEIDRTVVEPPKRKQLSVEDYEDLPPKDAEYKSWWGTWVGREEEFYLQCHAWVKRLTPSAFAKNVDEAEEGKRLLGDLTAKYDALERRTLPKTLVKNSRMRESHVGDKVVVTSYHRYDPFQLDKDLFEVVGMFRADQTLEQNLQRLKDDEGIEFTPDLIEHLYSLGVLVEPTPVRVAEAKEAAEEAASENAGELNGRRVALRAILEARGMAAGADGLAKISSATLTTLESWIKKAVLAKSAADVFRDP